MLSWPQKTVDLLNAVREQRPMIHHLTNLVVTNLTANVTLCLGAAPVMAPCIKEVEQMVSYAGALLLNPGTLDEALVESMLVAGRRANQLGVPVVLDPVGAGATDFRTRAAQTLLKEVKVSVLRGNPGEILTLVGAGGQVRGVDSMEEIGERDRVVQDFARERDLCVAVTGPIDLVCDGRTRLRIGNGHPILGQVTGTGCSATTAIAVFLAVARERPLEAAAGALAAYGLAAERAASRSGGPGTFVPQFLDALAVLNEQDLLQGVRIEEAE